MISATLEKLTRESLSVSLCVNKYAIEERQAAIVELKAQVKASRGNRKIAPLAFTIQGQVKRLEKEVAKLSAERIEGVFTPLTERDTWALDMHIHAADEELRGEIPLGLSKEGAASYDAARARVIGIRGMIYRVEYALKKPDGTRYFTHEEITALARKDPRIIVDLWQLHHEAFDVTEQELGESLAPTAVN